MHFKECIVKKRWADCVIFQTESSPDSDKIQSDPVLIRKIFENYQSDPVLIRPCKSCILFCLMRPKYQRCAWTGFWIFRSGLRLLPTGSWVRFLSCIRIRIGFGFVFTEKTLLVGYLTYIYQNQTGVGLLDSSWYRIRIGFGFTICKTGLDPESKNWESEHLYKVLLKLFCL